MPIWLLAVSLWWSNKAKPWLAKYWMWIFLPVGVVMLLLGWSRKAKKIEVVSTELYEADTKKEGIKEELEQKIEELKDERSEKVEDAVEARDEAVSDLVDEQRHDAGKLVDDPTALNAYLQNAGKHVRRG